MKSSKPTISRRGFLGGTAAGASGILLKSLATGIPPALLLNPRMALAQRANIEPQTLIMSVSSAGDPVNINCPGSYVNGVTNNPILSAVNTRFGNREVRAAQPWAQLPNQLRQRMAFFHHRTFAAAHPEFDETMTLRGAVKNSLGNGQEMLASMIAQLSQPNLGCFQPEPMVLDRQKITYQSQPLQTAGPVQLKSLFSGDNGALEDLRPLRDRTLDALYGQLRNAGTRHQKKFLERFVVGRNTARDMGNHLGQLLERLPTVQDEPNGPEDQVIAAVALARLNVAPVIVINIPFGRDNHQDSDLQVEADQTTRGVGNLALMWQELRNAEIQNQVSFAMLNVFGRTFHRNDRGGRNHNKDHSVMVAFGRHIRGGVYGGVNGSGQCLNIRANNGRGTATGGIDARDTMATAGRSLCAALGHDRGQIEERIHGGQILNPFLNQA